MYSERVKKGIRNSLNTIDDKFNFKEFSRVSESDSNLASLAKVDIFKISIH